MNMSGMTAVMGTVILVAAANVQAAGIADMFQATGESKAGGIASQPRYEAALIRHRVEAGISSVNGVRYESVTAGALATGLKHMPRTGGEIGSVWLKRTDQQTREVKVVVDSGSSPVYLSRLATKSPTLNIGTYSRITAQELSRGQSWQKLQARRSGVIDIASVHSEGAPRLRQVSIFSQLQSLKVGR